MPTPTQNLNPDTVLQFVRVASTFGKRATDALAAQDRATKQAADLSGPLVERMIATGAISPEQKQAADQALGTHAGALQVLGNAITKLAELRGGTAKQAGDGRLGAGVDASPAAADAPRPSPFVGARTGEKRASDRAFERALGFGDGGVGDDAGE